MLIAEYLTDDMLSALDTFAFENGIADREEAARRIFGDALAERGYLSRDLAKPLSVGSLMTESASSGPLPRTPVAYLCESGPAHESEQLPGHKVSLKPQAGISPTHSLDAFQAIVEYALDHDGHGYDVVKTFASNDHGFGYIGRVIIEPRHGEMP